MEKSDPNFFEQVHEVARLIPLGRVTSYGAIAKYLGAARSARMVGWAMGASGSASPAVPAHRVLNSKGELSARHLFATPTLMQELLENEGVETEDNRVKDWKAHFWDPSEELE